MEINRGNMNILYTGFKMHFQDGFGRAPKTYEEFSEIVTSTDALEMYPFLMQFTGMREWIGPRLVKNLEQGNMQLVNKDFEDTVKVKRNDVEDNKIGTYPMMLRAMGFSSEEIWDKLGFSALCAPPVWIDGKAFFATDRKYGKNTICNKATGALTATTFNTAYTTMSSYIAHNGEPLGVVPTHLVFGPKLRSTAWHIANDEFSYDGTDKVQVGNENKGRVKLIEAPRLVGDYDDYWFLMACGGPLKPVVVQKRKVAQLVRMDSETDPNVFNNNEFLYGTHARGNASPTMPHLIYAGIL